MARPRKPTALLEAKGTLEKNKKSQKNRVDNLLPMLPQGTVINPPMSLTNDNIKSLWISTTSILINWKILSTIDLASLEQAFIFLQEYKRINEMLAKLNPIDDDYSKLLNYSIKLSKQYNAILFNFGMSPVQRSKLTLEAMEAEHKQSILERIKKGE